DEEILRGEPSREADGADIDLAAAMLVERKEAGLGGAVRALSDPGAAAVYEAMVLGDPGLPPEAEGVAMRRAAEAGLLKIAENCCSPANPLVRDAALAEISGLLAFGMPRSPEGKPEGGRELDMSALLKAFQAYWQDRGSRLAAPFGMKRALGHLALTAFLHKAIGGGGALLCEYGLGRGRLDMLVRFRDSVYPVGAAVKESEQRLRDSLVHMSRYVERCRAKTGWLVAFDPDPAEDWERKISWLSDKHEGRTVHVVGA
ncbi:MAG: hypothetical protein LBQ12_05520, partial [Deltaproteobacteria bacterium]|nr:hypothetical protein [Deltaproteobacteria bacterium]